MLRFLAFLTLVIAHLCTAQSETPIDISSKVCTANDVVIGTGTPATPACCTSPDAVITGTFNFPVTATANSERACVLLHLCELDGAPAQDVFLGDLNGQGSVIFTAEDVEVPCSAVDPSTGLVCWTPVLNKGKCAAGECCSGVSYQVPGHEGTAPNQCPANLKEIVPSKCEFQKICVSVPSATLACVGSCSAACGGTVSLNLCASGFQLGTSLTFRLSDGQTATMTVTSTSSPTCHTFTVSSGGSYSGTVSGGGCTVTSGSQTVTIQTASLTLTSSGTGTCNLATNPLTGHVTFTATPNPSTLSFNWFIDNVQVTPDTPTSLTIGPALIGTGINPSLDTCRVVRVTSTTPGCSATASLLLNQCVTSSTSTGTACPA